MMKRSISFAIVFFTVFLMGCGSTQKMSDADRQAIRSISVNPEVFVVDEMFYMGPASGIGFMFGAIGGAITAAANMGPAEEIAEYARHNNVLIDNIVKQEFEKQIQGRKLFVVNGRQVDAQLNIKIEQYGIAITHGFSSVLSPVLRASAQLVDRHGKVVWENYDFVTAMADGTPEFTIDELKSDPKKLAVSWEKAAEIVVGNILKTI